METSTVDKVNQAISDLENLKAKIDSIKSRYNILNEDYSRLCEDAISIIIEYQTANDTGDLNPGNRTPEPHTIEERLPVGVDKTAVNVPIPAAEPVLEIADLQPAGCPSGDTARAIADYGIASDGTISPEGESLTSMEGLEIRLSRAPSLEEILAFQQIQLIEDKRKKKTAAKKINAQSVVDLIGDGIETGLDKLGNGLIYPFARITDLSRKITAPSTNVNARQP